MIRFESKYRVDKVTGCWNWMKGKFNTGYGMFWLNGKTVSAHRASWQINFGYIPDGLFVLHKCDNKRCVNPNHLFLGTAKDNTDDMISKGREVRTKPPIHIGTDNPNSKLTESDVMSIRQEYSVTTCSQRDLARKYSVSQPLIGQIIRKEIWCNI